MKRLFFRPLLFLIAASGVNAQELNKDAITTEVVRIMDSINKSKESQEKARQRKKVGMIKYQLEVIQ
jgi:purine-nucleoside phosphorylase